MAILASVLLLSALAQAPQAANPKLFGDVVPLEAPTPGATDYPDNIKSWSGWGALSKGAATFPKPFMVNGDWSTAVAAQKPSDAEPYRVKVILIPAVDLVYKTAQGNLDERRTSINSPCKTKIEQALLLAAAEFQLQNPTLGNVVYDTSVDNALYEETVKDGDGLGVDSVKNYVRSRINGGSFAANDKLFHGPYQLCIVMHAGLTPTVNTVESATPVTAISASVADSSTTACAVEILKGFAFGAETRAARQGREVSGVNGRSNTSGVLLSAMAQERVPVVFGVETTEQVLADVGFGPVSGDDYVKNLKPYNRQETPGQREIAYANMSPNAEMSLGADPAKGSFLSVKLGGLYPNGGYVLPPIGITGANHYLVFDFRTSSHTAVGIGDIQSSHGITLGERNDPGDFISGVADGAWHKVAVELYKLLPNGVPNTPGTSRRLYIGFLPGSKRLPRTSMISDSYDFANFSLSATKPDDASPIGTATGPSWDAAATAARAAIKAASTPENMLAVTDLITKSPEPIRLNALDALSTVKIADFEDKIASQVGNINPRITEAAAAALAFQDTPTSKAILSKTVSIGPGTHAKAVAAEFVGQRKDPASSGPISAIAGAAKDWHDRALAAQALAACGVPQAWLFLYSSLADDDPGVREIATNLVDPIDDTGMHRLMFVSVNDASDAVRAAACIKLLQSQTPEVKREGYRGTGDDSWWVRVQVLDWITRHPSADDRQALRQAVTGAYPQKCAPPRFWPWPRARRRSRLMKLATCYTTRCQWFSFP